MMEHDPFARDRGAHDRGVRHRVGAGLPLHPRRVPARDASVCSTRSRRRAAAGYLGDDVMGEGFAFDIELRRGAGAYICGEETALFNSLEGKRGEPRNKPPFPVQRGLFGKPTGINNVETLINVLEILRIGGRGLRADRHRGLHRHRASSASRATSERPGPVRGRLRHHAARAARAGGRRPRATVQAVLLGGAAGGFVTPDDLDIRAHVRGRARGRLHARLRAS